MALFHLSVTQTKRSAGQSAIASAAYRAGERLYSEYYGEYSDYTRKGGVICSDILLPSHAPPEYADRQTLWNAVEKAERGKNAQLAYSFDISPSYGTNYQKLGKELMSRDELAVMDGSKCVLQLRGVRPFLSDKYDLTQHPNYKYTADYDKKLTFDIEKYLSTRAKLYPKDEFFVMEEEN